VNCVSKIQRFVLSDRRRRITVRITSAIAIPVTIAAIENSVILRPLSVVMDVTVVAVDDGVED